MTRAIASLAVLSLAAAGVVTATTNGPAVDVSALQGIAKVVLNTSPTDAAGKTADIKLQHSADGATGWADVPINGAFAQVTNASGPIQELLVNTDRFKKFVRVVTTMGGSTPTVYRSVTIVGKL